MDERSLGLLLLSVAAVVAVLGLAIYSGALGWFGRLPGDIRWESGSVRVYFPLVSMLLVSVLLSAVLFVIRRLF